MAVFTCGEKASEVTTGEGSTGTGTGTTEVSATDVSATDVPTGSVSESASATEGPSTGPATGTAGMTSTSVGESTGGDSTGADESTSGDSSGSGGGETETTGEVVVVAAALNNACAPDDGPAVALRPGLVEPGCEAKWSDESLRIVLFMEAPLLPGVYPLGEGLGFATRQGMDEPDFVTAMAGSVTIEAWEDQAVVGTYSVTFADASVREGAFSGPYCDDDILCG